MLSAGAATHDDIADGVSTLAFHALHRIIATSFAWRS